MQFRILDREPLYQGFFRLECYTVAHDRFDGGSLTVRREHLERGDAVAVLLVDRGRDEVLLIEQFRIGPAVHGDDPWLVEIVAGMLDAGEDPEACARRECVEEAGYEPARLQRLGEFYTTPGGSSERITLYLGEVDKARPAADGGGLDHEHEDIRVLWVPRAQAMAWVAEGRIRSGTPMLALLLASGGASGDAFGGDGEALRPRR
jgi:ADP-ribose pyrophosphatase